MKINLLAVSFHAFHLTVVKYTPEPYRPRRCARRSSKPCLTIFAASASLQPCRSITSLALSCTCMVENQPFKAVTRGAIELIHGQFHLLFNASTICCCTDYWISLHISRHIVCFYQDDVFVQMVSFSKQIQEVPGIPLGSLFNSDYFGAFTNRTVKKRSSSSAKSIAKIVSEMFVLHRSPWGSLFNSDYFGYLHVGRSKSNEAHLQNNSKIV